METPVFFGEWLKQRRKTLDLTQEELAEQPFSSQAGPEVWMRDYYRYVRSISRACMRSITPGMVFAALQEALAT